MMKWKKGEHGRPESSDGRFYVQGHFGRRPGYYELFDTKTGRSKTDPKLKVLKALAEEIASADPT